MKNYLYITMIVLLGSATPVFAAGYDIIITCNDSSQTPAKTIELKLKSLGGSAALSYTSKDAKDSFSITVQDGQGPYSSSDVWIKRGYKSDNSGIRTLSVSAQHSEVFRVTHIARFTLELEEDAHGVYKAINVSMSRGTAEYPDSIKQKAEVFENMPCVLTRI